MRSCSKCQHEKDDDQFARDSSRPSGLSYHCKACRSAYAAERYLRLTNQTTISRAPNGTFDRSTYRKTNQWRNTEWSAMRRALKRQATPPWLTADHRNQIRDMYRRAGETNMHVDHIVPLINESVCGLHVPWNLQLLTPTDNLRKNNTHIW